MSTISFAKRISLGTAGTLGVLALTAGPASAETQVEEPDSFTSAFTVMAAPDEVVDAEGEAATGEAGAMGQFDVRVNSELEIICYDITLTGVTGDYESPAKTATHIHEAAAGEAGPPRISFPDPEDNGDGTRTSSGCLQGPFTTGLTDDDGTDHGEGFSLAQLEEDPSAFSADSHTEDFPAGVVRGQLSTVPVGGVDTGAGGTAETAGVGSLGFAAAGAAAVLAATGFALSRRGRSDGR